MGRVIFQGSEQTHFLRKVKLLSKLNSNQLGLLCQISGRTMRDWLRGKYTISDKALLILTKKFNLEIPQKIKKVDNYWYVTKGARKGALKRNELYGPPGTPEGRSKGGRNSQLKRRENPEKYRLLGCNTRNKFKAIKPSVDFAEAVGIILGDGAISGNQLRISLSSLVDQEYALVVSYLFERIFDCRPSSHERNNCNAIDLTISGVNLVEELERWGFMRGNKVKHQVGFPAWIWQDLEFQKACIRGLMDTDGGCYFHKHKVNSLIYRNFGMCFTNKSLPIVQSVAKVLKSLGLKFSLAKKETQIYIYSFEEIKKYFKLVGSHNPKNWKKFNYYLNQKTHRLITKVGFGSGLTGDPGKIVWA